jgi:hypothetical protein
MGFLVPIAAIIAVYVVWRLWAPRCRPQNRGVYLSESYRRKIAATASDFQSRSEFAASRRYL